MLYWPATTTGGDFCALNSTLLTATLTMIGKPNTTAYSGTTLTSPTVYIVYGTVEAFDQDRNERCQTSS